MPSTSPEISFEAYGVPLAVRATHQGILERARPYLPPGWKPSPPEKALRRFEIRQDGPDRYSLLKDDRVEGGGLGLELSVLMLDTELRLFIARKAPGLIFVHAGVVAHNGRALVIPGLSFAGKTSLVAALVREGAHYYSDEFAVLDVDGLVHPYAKPLSIRDHNRIQFEHDVETLGGVAGEGALPVGLVAVTTYKPGAVWQPKQLSAGEGAIAVLANTVPARERPQEALHAIKHALEGAVVLESDRGEAEELAPILLAELEKTTP
jgi:hypothetical protein